MSVPKYVSRFVRITRAMEILHYYPAGMRLDDLAAELDTDTEDLRDEIRAYYAAEIGVDQLAGGYHEPVIEFIAGPDGVDDDPAKAGHVRLRDLRPSGTGTKYLSLAQLAEVSRTGHHLATLEPENTELIGALDVLDHSILSGLDTSRTPWLAKIARPLRDAMEQRRLVKIRYARTWQPGVVERTIAPYRITHTRRGWEVDAGRADEPGKVRTYLVSGIQELEVQPETFDVPAGIDDVIDANRQEQTVELVVPHGMRWAVEAYAESIEVLEEDEESLKVRAQMLPPLPRRVGLLLVAAGPDAFVVQPKDLVDAGRGVASQLLAHHTTAR